MLHKVQLILTVWLLSLTSVFATDYFWIGGSGNWSDLSHWATESGGTVNHAQAPTSNDDVFFDANSFTDANQQVSFNLDNVFFRNMNWTGIPLNTRLIGSSDTQLNCFGAFNLDDNVAFNFDGTLVFTGEGNSKTIHSSGNRLGKIVMFNGVGEWLLTDELLVDSVLNISQGLIDLNDQTIEIPYLEIQGSANKTLRLRNSLIEITGEFVDFNPDCCEGLDIVSAKINTDNLNIEPGNSTVRYSAMRPEIRFEGNGTIEFWNVETSQTDSRLRFSSDFYNPTINYNQLSFAGSAEISGQHNSTSLNLSPSKIYIFQSGLNYRFDNITASGSCAQNIGISTDQAGVQSTFTASSDVNLSFVTLRDIRGDGAGFSADNSTDLGNNDNWVFTNSDSFDYYWIGGTGVWDDPEHWSFSSGGPSSGCVPTGKDNVFFDINSFSAPAQIVNINLDDLFVHNMTWINPSQNSRLSGDETSRVHITGSLRFDQNLIHEFQGDYFFESNESDLTIEMNGVGINGAAVFSGPEAAWQLLDDFRVELSLDHNSGRINTNGNELNVWRYRALSENPTHLNIENSNVILRPTLDEFGFEIFRPQWVVQSNNYTTQTMASSIIFRSGFFTTFEVRGENKLSYNNVIFESYGGTLSGFNFIDSQDAPFSIDSLVFHQRGNYFSHLDINYCALTAGFDYIVQNDSNVNINELDANGNCEDGLITVASFNNTGSFNLFLNQDHDLTRWNVSNVNNSGTGNLSLSESFDGGKNTNITIDGDLARTLYWVGNGGEWEDPNHWSLSSGGPPGACVPTPLDDVIFDENSFSEDFQSVYSVGNRVVSCHNMTWQNISNNPTFGTFFDPATGNQFFIDRVLIYGSLIYDTPEQMFVNHYWHRFLGTEQDSIVSNGNRVNGIEKWGAGDLTFKDDLLNYNISLIEGTIDMDNINLFTLDLTQLSFLNENSLLRLNNSNIFLGSFDNEFSQFWIDGEGSVLEAGSSTMYLIATVENRIVTRGSQSERRLNRVISTDPQASVWISDRFPWWADDNENSVREFTSLQFSGDAVMEGFSVTDTLIGAPGKSYVMESELTQTVNSYLQLIGNNCTPISLSATGNGTRANLSMPQEANMLVDFVEMRDNNGIGGADFNAGERSTDVGASNQGWLFEDPPDFIEVGFLGPDRSLCEGSDLILNAFNFSPSETYLWNDNSTDTTLIVTTPGIYSVEVTFSNGCSITDEIEIFSPQQLEVQLPDDTTICEGETLTLDGTIPLMGATYNWTDGEIGPIREISESGVFTLVVTVDGCSSEDDIEVVVQERPIIDLGVDQSFCEDENFTLDAFFPNANYLWQDGSTMSGFDGDQAGLYWVELNLNNCTFRDSINISIVEKPPVDIGDDVFLCEGTDLLLSTEDIADAVFTWQDGSLGNTFNVTQGGPHVVTVDVDGCVNTDSIFVTLQELAVFDLGMDQNICEGEMFTLDATVAEPVTYLWQDGSIDPTFSGSAEGLFFATTTLNGCMFSDSISIGVVPLPDPMLVSDTTLCEGDVWVVETDIPGLWQDGTISDMFTIDAAGTYTVILDDNGCVAEGSVDVSVQTRPEVSLGADVQLCQGEQFTLELEPNFELFEWEDGSNDLQRQIDQSGIYWVSVNENDCESRDSILIDFQALPTLELGTDTTVCEDLGILLTPQKSEGIITWPDGSSGDSFQVSSAGLIVASIDNNGCGAVDSLFIDFKSCSSFEAFIPNVFSPNGDNENDVFFATFDENVIIHDFKMSIFDRWGNRIFNSNALSETWDGRNNEGNLASDGVYVYKIEVEFTDDFTTGVERISGSITLIK